MGAGKNFVIFGNVVFAFRRVKKAKQRNHAHLQRVTIEPGLTGGFDMASNVLLKIEQVD
jgi:hypothetical protein